MSSLYMRMQPCDTNPPIVRDPRGMCCLLLCCFCARGRKNEINVSLTGQSARVSQISAGELTRQQLLLRYYSLLFDPKNCARGSAQLLRLGLQGEG